jgi:hypothetical protein
MTYPRHQNGGALFPNKRAAKPGDPNMSGTIDVDGKLFWISAWRRTSRAGVRYLSLSVEPKTERPKIDERPQPVRYRADYE